MSSSGPQLVNIPPYTYVHVLDTNTNVTRLICGPVKHVVKAHERLIFQAQPMIRLPYQTYVKIGDPILKSEKGEPVMTSFGQVKIRFGDSEIRTYETHPEPFPLYPGENVASNIEKFILLKTSNDSLRLEVQEEFEENSIRYLKGDVIVVSGPKLYCPRKEVSITQKNVKATQIPINSALLLEALRPLNDYKGVARRAGEQWLIREESSYTPGPYESIVRVVKGIILSDKVALLLLAQNDFTDIYGIKRRTGETWLITNEKTNIHIPDVFEEVLQEVPLTTLTNRQYCVIYNPVQKGVNKWGCKMLCVGQCSFFLQPGEVLEGGRVQDIHVLSDDEAILLEAQERFDDNGIERAPGERWLIKGPLEYTPPIQVKIAEKRKAIPLDTDEGIYVQNTRTGEIRAHIGSTYLLGADEVLWAKELPEETEVLLAQEIKGLPYIPPSIDARGNLVYEKPDISNYKRDKTRVISYHIAANKVAQLYDYKRKSARVIFGPNRILLNPDEVFTILRLSGGKPKVENVIKSLSLALGPDFMTDQLVVETSDHAQLKLELSYSWHFDYDPKNAEESVKIFSVKDFVGDACKSIASRIRGVVSGTTYNEFHHNSSQIIKKAVFGIDSTTKLPRERLMFTANNLVITSVDIRSQEPLDKDISEKLQRNTHIAIEIKSKTTEAKFKHQAALLEQESKGQLELLRLHDENMEETQRKKLLEIQCESREYSQVQRAKLKAECDGEKERVMSETDVKLAESNLKKTRLEVQKEVDLLRFEKELQLETEIKSADHQIASKKLEAQIEVDKVKRMIAAIGPKTLVAMARAGPEAQAKLLSGLGLQGYLISDGKSPINLFNTASGFLGAPQATH